jgi:hypothetical protein
LPAGLDPERPFPSVQLRRKADVEVELPHRDCVDLAERRM